MLVAQLAIYVVFLFVNLSTGDRSVVNPSQDDHAVTNLGTDDYIIYDRQIENTFSHYFDVQQICINGLTNIIKMLEDKDGNFEHLTKQKQREIRDDLFEGKLIILKVMDKTTSLREQWQNLRKYPMYADFLKSGQTTEIKEAISSMVKAGAGILVDISSSNKYLQSSEDILSSQAPQSLLDQLQLHLTTSIDKMVNTDNKSIMSQALYVFIFIIFFAKLVEAFLERMTWHWLFLLVVPALLSRMPPSEEFSLGEVDNLAMTIIKNVRPFLKTDWRKLPMTDGSWAKAVQFHMHMDQLGEAFELMVQNQQNSLQTFKLSIWFESKMGSVSSWIVRRDYSELASSMLDAEIHHSELQKKIVSHLLTRKEFVRGFIFNVFQATDIESLLNYLEGCFDIDDELSREHEEILLELQEAGRKLKTVQDNIGSEQKYHDRGKDLGLGGTMAAGLVVGVDAGFAAAGIMGILTVSTMGLAAIIGTAVTAGGGFMVFGKKVLEHNEQAAILKELEEYVEQCNRYVAVEREHLQPLSTKELREGFVRLRKILSQYLSGTSLSMQNMQYYFGEVERAGNKFVKTLDGALAGFKDLAQKNEHLIAGNDDIGKKK